MAEMARTGCPPDSALRVLVDAAFAGDAESQVTLFERCIRPIVRWVVVDLLLRWRGARRNLREERDDLEQDALRHLLEAGVLRKWDPALGAFAAFIKVVATNHTLKTLCTRKRNPWFQTPTEDVEIEAMLPGVHGAEERVLISKQALRLIADELGEEGTRLLYLFYVEGLTASEVSKITGKTEAAVDRARNRLCKRAKEFLDALSERAPGSGNEGGERR